MGCYDIVGNIQIKCTDCSMHDYKLGDGIELSNGIYIGYEGAFVVIKNKIVFITESVFDKWGNRLDCGDIIREKNPIMGVLKTFMVKGKEKKSVTRRKKNG